MAVLKPKEGDRRAKMEVEANRFSSLILMPPPALRTEIGKKSAPSLDVSKDAMARAYTEYHSETIAFVVVRDGKVLRNYRNKIRFPYITALSGKAVPCRATSIRDYPKTGLTLSAAVRPQR